jgi:hypothetical protein
MSRTYEIGTLGDFSKVPDERIEACLHEFAMAIRLHKLMLLLAEPNPVEAGVFRWTDDDKHHYEVTIVEKPATPTQSNTLTEE